MSNHKQSDDFLKGIAKDIKDNNYDFNHGLFNYIYHKLIFQGVKGEDRKRNLSDEGVFAKWCRKGRPNTNTFVSPTWTYFCQFISSDNKALRADNHIKVYIPLDADHIERGVNEIFDFLDKNNISHLSKVGQKIRFDDVVVRLVHKEDLNKLLEFIKNNKYIQEGLIKPNSFAYNEDNIALACDGSLSYNAVLSNYIMLYMKKLASVNELDKASVKGFYQFLINYYATTFVDERNPERPYVLKKFANDFDHVFNEGIDINDKYVLDSYKYITKLMIESQAKDYKLDNFIGHYTDLINKKFKDSNVDFVAVDEMLARLIEIMVQKADANYTIWNIIKYIETGQANYITRFGDSRNMVCNSSFREDMLYMLKMKDMNAHDYVRQFYNKMFTLDENIMDLIKEYLAYGDYKYGREDTREYLEGYVSSNNPAYITRDNDFRERFKEIKLAEKVMMFIKTTGKNIDDVIEMCRPRRK